MAVLIRWWVPEGRGVLGFKHSRELNANYYRPHTFAEVSNEIQAHRDEEGDGPTEHFVNAHRVSGGE
jgi:hypothetical protein